MQIRSIIAIKIDYLHKNIYVQFLEIEIEYVSIDFNIVHLILGWPLA